MPKERGKRGKRGIKLEKRTRTETGVNFWRGFFFSYNETLQNGSESKIRESKKKKIRKRPTWTPPSPLEKKKGRNEGGNQIPNIRPCGLRISDCFLFFFFLFSLITIFKNWSVNNLFTLFERRYEQLFTLVKLQLES